jgi:hypothetical protein
MKNSNFSATFTLSQLSSKLRIGRNTLTTLLREVSIFKIKLSLIKNTLIEAISFAKKKDKTGIKPSILIR